MPNIQELMSLKDRVSVITGGGAGLGLQMATGLAEAGSNIVICSRKNSKNSAFKSLPWHAMPQKKIKSKNSKTP
jgi:NAD(P)-dependent dehydrogenase (short-subunit alcohol dehydrogenase family)